LQKEVCLLILMLHEVFCLL